MRVQFCIKLEGFKINQNNLLDAKSYYVIGCVNEPSGLYNGTFYQGILTEGEGRISTIDLRVVTRSDMLLI
jgi:hypothetical protein